MRAPLRFGLPRLVLPLLLLFTSCGEQRPLHPTAEQDTQLNEAETMLDQEANEEGPADRSAGPPNEPSARR